MIGFAFSDARTANSDIVRVQRKCASDSRTPTDRACWNCEGEVQPGLKVGEKDDPLEMEADRVAERILNLPTAEPAGSIPIHGYEGAASGVGQATTGVHPMLNAAGRPLPRTIRTDMEHRFGRDFSEVRVHDGPDAARSARSLNAQAFTAGNHIAFDSGRFAPTSGAGRRLLAHELTHVVQQSGASEPLRLTPNPVDEQAKKIIDAAKDDSKTVEQRSIDTVWAIIKTYYDASLVSEVVFVEKSPIKEEENFKGLQTSPVGKGTDIKGKITVVSDYFVKNIGQFARRVLQVGHELQHVQQQRAGMGGENKKKEREFLAFHWEATQTEKSGTGRMSHATRVDLIDQALRNYYCMPADVQKTHAEKKEELLTLRSSEETASGHDHTEPPKECK